MYVYMFTLEFLEVGLRIALRVPDLRVPFRQ